MLHNILFILPIVTGSIFIVAGFLLGKYPPKNINILYGYRTTGSMKSQSNWDFAQAMASKELMKMGAIVLLTSIAGLFYNPGELISLVITFSINIALIIYLIVRVETALKKL